MKVGAVRPHLLPSLLRHNDAQSTVIHRRSGMEVKMGMAWRQTLNERNERFGAMADHFDVDLDPIAAGVSAAELGEALGRCLTCERQTECSSWQALPAAERRAAPDFCPNRPFFGLHSTRNAPVRDEPPRSRVIRFLDYFDDLLTCVASVESRHRPPDGALMGIGIDPGGPGWDNWPGAAKRDFRQDAH